ncbi:MULTISPECIES: C1 family peptidase [Lactobacillus]|uniref:Aminopeptidase n=1 Tax=Lactobacillus xujianguonis TaxID=2495899 RepID=A0A437SUY8_9LACO|nr:MULTISPECIES: C1 family peptidase [Lactobacillus]RVU70746.1 aminopeptidase [Lactobacillus xujianguonis]RVU73993.1 aminopeptidase [Lactobacillus xujianguonis]
MTELTEQELEAFSADFNKNKDTQIASRAARRSGLLEASFNDRVSERQNHVFSTELDIGDVTDQKHSGRCWEFSSLNILRHYFGKKYHVKNFTFSQAFNFFWDKIERANAFYNKMIELGVKPLDDREVDEWLGFAGQDGGLWQMAVNLFKKYGVVPSYAMPESFNSNNTTALIDSLARKERKDALVLRKLVQEGKFDEAEKTKKQFLNEVYRMVAVALGEPPKKFDLEYRDDDKKYHLEKDLTPRQFMQKYLGDFPFDDYVVLLNSPNFEYGKRYHQGIYDNVAGGGQIVGLNLPIEDLAQAAVAQLKGGDPVMFGNDVLKQMERKTGFLDTELYKTDDLFHVNTQMSKADRLATGEGSATHDMTLVGVDEDHGEIIKWKVENSWGDKFGDKGFYSASHEWFKEYVYDVIVNKKYLSKDQLALLDQPAIDLKPWQHIGL